MLVLRWHPPLEPLRLRWIVPAAAALAVEQSPALPQLAAVIGTPGERGLGGEDAPAATLVVDLPIAAGTPLAISRSSPRLIVADAAMYARATVVGLAMADTAAGFAADAKGQGLLSLDDWSAITGAPLLVRGAIYFLAAGGGLTLLPPSAAGSSVVEVGEAVTPNAINLRPQPPILL